jgi:hypothetical protein
MTPEQQAERLYDRIMREYEAGQIGNVKTFMPMAIAAYERLSPLNSTRRYDLGRIGEVGGDIPLARAQADTILKARPTHLLGLIPGRQGGSPREDDARARTLDAKARGVGLRRTRRRAALNTCCTSSTSTPPWPRHAQLRNDLDDNDSRSPQPRFRRRVHVLRARRGKIDTEGLTYVHELQDIESLTQRAMRGELEVTAVSIHAYAYLSDRYAAVAARRVDGRQVRPASRARALRPPAPT